MKITTKKVTAIYEYDVDTENESIGNIKFRLETLSDNEYFWGIVYREDLYRLQPFDNSAMDIADEEIWVKDCNFEALNRPHNTEDDVIKIFMNKLDMMFNH